MKTKFNKEVDAWYFEREAVQFFADWNDVTLEEKVDGEWQECEEEFKLKEIKMIYKEKYLAVCPNCGGNLVERTMLWYGNITKRLQCLKCKTIL